MIPTPVREPKTPFAAVPQRPSATSLLERVAASAESPLPPPRMLVVLAHPDDEVLAFGARLERLRDSRILTVTDGTPQNGRDAAHHGFASLAAYRDARRKELAAALACAGLSTQVFYSAPGLPFSDQTAAFHLEALTEGIATAIRQLAPEVLLTHPYEGGHPDHDACAFAVQSALARLEKTHSQSELPVVVEAPFYHANPAGGIQTGVFLPAPTSSAVRCILSPQEQERKQQRLACFASQQQTLQQFGTEQESFRVSPDYDFLRPPHPGTLFYEHFAWGMTGSRFCTLVAAALKGMGLSMESPIPVSA